MISPKHIVIFLSVVFLFHYATSAKQAVVSRKSKLCGNAACEEVLFKSRVKRVMGVNNDPSFLNLAENSIISVVAVKFSDRPDIMEGRLDDAGPTGFFYAGAIDSMPFAEFLRTAIDEKKEMLMISQNPADVGEKRIVGVVHSETDLVRDYNAKNTQAAAEHGLPAPELLPIPEPTGGHGHSHGGHGHSHGGHGHSHGEHGHSHGHPAPTPAPITTPPPVAAPNVTPAPQVEQPKVELPKVEDIPKEQPKEDIKPEINLNNVLGSPPQIPPVDMDAEIERMIQEEEAAFKAKKQQEVNANQVNSEVPVEEVTQPPLVLSSLPTEPVTPPPAEIVPEAVPVPELKPEVPSVTPLPVVQVVPEVTPAPVEAVTLPPLEPITPPPAVQDPIAQYIPPQPVEVVTPPPVVVEEIVTTTPAPIPVAQEVFTTPPPPPPQEEPTGVCYKDECDGLQTPPPQAATPEILETPEVVTPSPMVQETPAPAISQEEEDFIKWEAERKKREEPAQPYEDSYGQQFKDLAANPPPQSSGVINFIRTSCGLGNITDGSVIFYLNVTFVVASLLLYIIVRSLSSGSDSDVLDRQAYFDLVTKHKQLELQMQAKNAEIQNLQAAGVQHQQQQQTPNHEPELLSLRQQVSQLHNELQIAQSQRQELELHLNQLREVSEHKESQIGTLNDAMTVYKERLERSANEAQEWARQLDAARAELNESQQNAVSRQQELVHLQQEHDAAQQKIHDVSSETTRALNTRIAQLEQANNELEIELKDLKQEITGYLETIQQLELEKSQMEVGSAAESGGSGWSDFGEMDEVEDKEKKAEKEEKTPVASITELAEIRARCKKYGEELEELTALKNKLEAVEKELHKYKNLYEKVEKEKSEYESKLKNAEADVLEAKKKLDEIVTEKKDMGDSLKDTIKLLNSTITKTSDTDKVVSTLREEGFAKDKQLLEADSALRKKDEKIRELDAEFKRVQREYTKLETKSFHDVMKLKKELDDYKTSQILGSQNISLNSRDMFNSSDIRPLNDRGLGSPLDDPIWDEPEYAPNHQVPTLQQEDYFSSGSMTMPSKRRSSRRSDHRLVGGELSPIDREDKTKSKKDGVHRRRSRSHGRQMPMYNDPYAMAYMPGSSDSSFMSQHAPGFQPLSGRHSKSGHLQTYSSGGSNGGRSPPPEMPLLSAIPPPGARKPTSKRPDLSHHGK